jgi:hypothetical protein
MTFACPVCAEQFDNDAVLEVHVHSHFDETNTQQSHSFHATLSNVSERDVIDQLLVGNTSQAVQTPMEDVTSDDEATIDMQDDDGVDASIPAPSQMMLFSRKTQQQQDDDDFALALALSVADEPQQQERPPTQSPAHAASLSSSNSEPWIVPSRLPNGDPICAVATVANVVSLCGAHAAPTAHSGVFALCSDVDQFQSRWDRGWGCGWRNLQQFLSALSKRAEFARLLWHGGELGRVPDHHRSATRSRERVGCRLRSTGTTTVANCV